MKNVLLLTAMLAIGPVAQASCEDRLADWAAQLEPDREYNAGNAACKPWPADPALTLAAIAFLRDDASDEAPVRDLLLVVADSKSGVVKARLLHESAIKHIPIKDQLMQMIEIKLDTAPYQLTAAKRAFGVRAVFDDHSLFSAGLDTLNLYVIDGSALRPVLTQMVVHTNSVVWDGQCAGKANDMDRAVSLGAPGKDGYAALLVSEQSKVTVSTVKGDDCKHKPGPVKREKYTLNYAAGQYVLPQALSDWKK